MLVGDGLKMPEVRRLVGPPEIARFVTLTGLVAQSEAPRYLACADLLLSPTCRTRTAPDFFGSPTKLFEYMAMEKPIVASALGQIEDVIAGRGATRLGALPPGAGAPCGSFTSRAMRRPSRTRCGGSWTTCQRPPGWRRLPAPRS